jgi:DNA-binding transcriptional LysR family regulator
MSISGKDLNLLIALKVLLEEANVTRAGERLNMSQSSMSTALAKLRTQFSDELLVRVGRDYELTPQARLLLPQLQRTLPLIQKALLSEGEFEPAQARNSFRLVMSDYSATQLNRMFPKLLEQAPGIEFEIGSLPDNPADGDHELWVSDFAVAPTGVGFDGESLELFVDHYVCVLDKDNPALVDGQLSWDAFVALPQVLCVFGRNHLTPADRKLRDLGFTSPPKIVTRSFLPIPAIVSGTDQVGIIPSRLAHSIPARLGAVIVEPPFGRIEIRQKLWWHESKNPDPAHKWFREVVEANLNLMTLT